MAVSAEDRRRWERQVAGLRAVERERAPTADTLARIVEAANRSRAAHGIAPLADRFADPPEAGLHRRAEHLGLLRPRG
jgi:hypothetical protein